MYLLITNFKGFDNDMLIGNLSQLFSNPGAVLMQLAYTIPVILISLTLHEWAHAYAAFRCGDPTARNL